MTRGARWHEPSSKTWRVTTATRVFVLALAAGQAWNAGVLPSTLVILLSLGIVAGIASATELNPQVEASRWMPLAEGVVAGALLGTAGTAVAPLFAYLAVPPIVAGIRHGHVSALNAALATAASALAAVAGLSDATVTGVTGPLILWTVMGLGTGLLTAWLSRTARALETQRGPYLAAHRLLSQLHSVSQQFSPSLDSRSIAWMTLHEARDVSDFSGGAIFLGEQPQDLVCLASTGRLQVDAECIGEALRRRRPVHGGRCSTIPLVVAGHVIGAAVFCWSDGSPTPRTTPELQHVLDEHSLRLDTARLFENVRRVATTEERTRIAREIHDGVAQEVASLGYLIDDAAHELGEPARAWTERLRQEVTRIVGELRLSIFDLRHGVAEAGGLAGALAEYTREVGVRGDLRVHLLLDEQGLRLAPHVEAEVLRIGQEAIGNVRRHAYATNLWVSLVHEDGVTTLRVEDDGRGQASPREGHYGLLSMQERADGIGAGFWIEPREPLGTVVTLQVATRSQDDRPTDEGVEHDHARAPHR